MPNPDESQADPVRAFLGCLMCSRAERARELLAGMRASDAGSGIRGVVMDLVVRAAGKGIAPDPQVLVAEARRRGLMDTEHRAQTLVMWVFETYQHAPYPEAGWFLRTAVLEHAYRRELAAHAQRLTQAVETSDLETLAGLVEPDDALVDLGHRLRGDLARWTRTPDTIERSAA